MNPKDEAIKVAASMLAQALTEGGKQYTIYAHAIDVTCIESEGRQIAYTVEVEELSSPRRIAP